MKTTEINRRDFNRLTSAAFGGMVAGAMIGCNQPQQTADKGGDKQGSGDAGSGTQDDDHGHDGEHADGGDHDHAADSGPGLLIEGKNVCRGLNHKCANHKGGTNACAGQGACATADSHTCHEANACKGQGGCGEHPGENACKGKGACAVPLGDEAWAKARKTFEAEMTEHGKKFGPAPSKPTS